MAGDSDELSSYDGETSRGIGYIFDQPLGNPLNRKGDDVWGIS
jgi:hypothetical protein